MKISKQELQKIIAEETEKLYAEELQKMLQEGEIDEGIIDRSVAALKGAKTSIGGGVKAFGASALGKLAKAGGYGNVATAADTQKANIQAQTQAKKDAINLEQVIIPKVDNLVGDLQKLFAGREQEEFFKKIMISVNNLKLRVKQMQAQVKTAGVSTNPLNQQELETYTTLLNKPNRTPQEQKQLALLDKRAKTTGNEE